MSHNAIHELGKYHPRGICIQGNTNNLFLERYAICNHPSRRTEVWYNPLGNMYPCVLDRNQILAI